MKIKAILFLLGLSFLFFCQESLAFRVAPGLLKIKVRQGERAVAKVRLIATKEEERAILYVADYFVNEDGGVKFEAPSRRYTARTWIRPNLPLVPISVRNLATGKTREEMLPVISVRRGEEKEVEIEVFPPKETVGEYFATLHFRDLEPTSYFERDIATTYLYFAAAVRIEVEVEGWWLPKRSGKAESKTEFKENGEIKILSIFENTGDIHLIVKGECFIKRKQDGRVFDRIMLKGLQGKFDGSAYLLPEGKRIFEGFISRPLPSGDYEAETVFDFGAYEKIRTRTSFPLTQAMSSSQKELFVLALEPKEIQVKMIPGKTSIFAVEIFNLDFLPLEVEVEGEISWLAATTRNFIIPAERSTKIGLMVRLPKEGLLNKKELKIIFRPSRGKEVELPIIIVFEE